MGVTEMVRRKQENIFFRQNDPVSRNPIRLLGSTAFANGSCPFPCHRKFSDIEYPVDGQATKKNIKKILAISEEVHKDVKVGHDQHGERTAEEEAIIVSGKRVFFHLIKEYRQQAQAGLNAIAAAVTGKKSAEKKQELQSHAYLHWFSNVWRKVHLHGVCFVAPNRVAL